MIYTLSKKSFAEYKQSTTKATKKDIVVGGASVDHSTVPNCGTVSNKRYRVENSKK